jgi:hypothetical protein
VSEPSQLYARVRLSRARFDGFLNSSFPDPSADGEILAWLGTAEYYGERYTSELIRERVAPGSTIVAWVDELMAPAPYGIAMPGRNSYDDATQTWTLAALDFSENYDDYIAAIAVFREAAKYKDLPGDDGFLIYGFLFENQHVEVAMRIGINSTEFLEDDAETEPFVSEANAAMEALMPEG